MFSPKDLVPPADKELVQNLVKELDTRFKKLVENGWSETDYNHRIYLTVFENEEPILYRNVLESNLYLRNFYASAGWAEVFVYKIGGKFGKQSGVCVELRINLPNLD